MSPGFTDEEWRSHLAFVEQQMEELRRNDFDSRTLCGRLDSGRVLWSAERRVQQRYLLKDLWDEQAPRVCRDGKTFFLAGPDSGDKVAFLSDPKGKFDPDEYLIIDAFRIEEAMAARKMIPQIEGLSPMEASALVHEEAWQLAWRLAQRARGERCNVVWVSVAAIVEPAASGPPVGAQHVGGESTIRALVEKYEHNGMGFSDLAAALALRCSTRRVKELGSADWGEVYRRAEIVPDDDDLFWISVAEDRGLLTVEQAERILDGAAQSTVDSHPGAGPSGKVGASIAGVHTAEDASTQLHYFADGKEALIRTADDGVGSGELTCRSERYWGLSAGWLATSPGCGDWGEDIRRYDRYHHVDDAEVSAIAEGIDRQDGGVFRDGGRFWDDQAQQWTASRAHKRIAELQARMADKWQYDNYVAYQSDRAELSRLQTHLEQSGNATEPAGKESGQAGKRLPSMDNTPVYYASDIDGVRFAIIDPDDADMSGWSIEVADDPDWGPLHDESEDNAPSPQTTRSLTRWAFNRDDRWFRTEGVNGRGWNGLGFGTPAYPWSAVVDHGQEIVRWIPPDRVTGNA